MVRRNVLDDILCALLVVDDFSALSSGHLLLESCVTRKLDEKRRFFDQGDVEPPARLRERCHSKDNASGNCNHMRTMYLP